MLERILKFGIDVRTTIIVLFVGFIFLGILLLRHGIRTMQYGMDISYVEKRKKIIRQGLWIIGGAIFFGIIAIVCGTFGEELVYQVYEPSATITLTPSITPSLTITLTPTITPSPTITRTPSTTSTPYVPDEIAAEFLGTLEPGSNIVFSAIKFSDEIDEYYQPIVEKSVFEPPLGKVYGSFTYNNMQPGLQWTAIWVNPLGEVICYETEVWGDYTGGYGYTECEYDSTTWVDGEYQVQLFLGLEWWLTNTFQFGQNLTETPSP